jgi:hypothetical protein
MEPSAVQPAYRPLGMGSRFLLYAGDIRVPGTEATVPGQIELELHPGVELRVRVTGPGSVSAWFNGDVEDGLGFSLPPDADLTPPEESVLGDMEEVDHSEFHAAQIQAGDLESAQTLLFHVGGGFEAMASPLALDGGGFQPQVHFALPGWDLALLPGTPTRECRDFAAVVAAYPANSPVSADDVARLQRWLFLLLTFVANREVDGPACALGEEGRVVWADWTTPRMKPGKSGVTWCPPMLVQTALPEIAAGLGAVAADPDLEVIVDRAIGYSLAANGEEVIEVRIPIVCSGLELLAWAILGREDWLVDAGARRRLGTAANVRLLLNWASIPTAIPASLPTLERRLRASGKPEWGGPEVLFDIRNAMVHPPKRLAEPEWPDGDLLFEAWQLGTWYLELALLRILGYEGPYWSRVRLGRPGTDVEPVPWCPTD